MLTKLSSKVFYMPHQPETDRPMLAYIKGGKLALAIDAGNSASHVEEFYGCLDAAGLKEPDFTVLTHWHWDHTFGMHRIHGLSIAHKKTNELLKAQREKLNVSGYADFLKEDDPCLGKEYAGGKEITVVPSDIQFDRELALNLGGLTANIFHGASPHSEDTVFIHLPEEKILFLGDSTSEDFYNDGYMDLDKLWALIRMIESIDCRYCVLSHTDPLLKSELLCYLKSI